MKWIHITYIIYVGIYNMNICECRTHAEPLGCEGARRLWWRRGRGFIPDRVCARVNTDTSTDGPKTVSYLFEYRVVQVVAQKPSLTANRDFGLFFCIIFVIYCYTYKIMFFGLQTTRVVIYA